MKTVGLNKVIRLVMVVLMALPIPDAALAANVKYTIAQQQMVSTDTVLETVVPKADMSVAGGRVEMENDIKEFLKKEDVKSKLKEKGLSADEISSRLASLSDSELQMMSKQVQEARAGGDILVAILLVVLIIYFARRI